MNPWHIALSAAAAGAGLAAWGAFHPASQLFGRTLRRLPAGRIALTFDDGPNPAVTPRLLGLLERRQVRATFFLIGRHVRACPELAREIAARGHTLGNHTETHPSLLWLSAARILDELHRCQDAVAAATGRAPRWFRPPYGYRGPQLDGAWRSLLRTPAESGLPKPECVTEAEATPPVMWSVSACDWRVETGDGRSREEALARNATRVVERLRPVRGGDIVLLHDGAPRALGADRLATLAALEFWLPRWKDAGLEFAALDDSTPPATGQGSGA
jgi:peptidoglycan/xylan/chitin deacetylase (PgdA/CDA1 family)